MIPNLDRHITGNYGQDQFPRVCPRCRELGYTVRLEEGADGSYCPECGWGREEQNEEDDERG